MHKWFCTMLPWLGLASLFSCATVDKPEHDATGEPIYVSRYTTPFPLQKGGEKVSMLVRVKKTGVYEFNLVFVERREWPQEKKERQRELFEGFRVGEDYAITGMTQAVPWPIKLKFYLENVEGETPVLVDKVVASRNRNMGGYGTSYPPSDPENSIIWRARVIHGHYLKPGLYRVRVENLSPNPDFDFETLFEFLHFNRKV